MTNYEKLCDTIGIFAEWIYTVQQFGNFYVCGKQPLQENAHLFKERRTAKVKKAEKLYPIFTAEKQIELIELIAYYFSFSCYKSLNNNDYVIGADAYFFNKTTDFTEALAGLTLQLVEAGELNKEEVRKVLE